MPINVSRICPNCHVDSYQLAVIDQIEPSKILLTCYKCNHEYTGELLPREYGFIPQFFKGKLSKEWKKAIKENI